MRSISGKYVGDPRQKPFKAITLPFKTDAEYQRLITAAKKTHMKPTSFMVKAIKDAIDKELGQYL